MSIIRKLPILPPKQKEPLPKKSSGWSQLNLSTHLVDQVEPFFHLSELSAAQIKGKWYLSTESATRYAHFLDNLHTLIAIPKRSPMKKPIARVHFISYLEFRLLAFLHTPLQTDVLSHLLICETEWKPHKGSHQLTQTTKFRELVQRYLQQRETKLLSSRHPLTVGDMLEFNFALHSSSTAIYNGTKFVDLVWDPVSQAYIIPQMFKSPAPFPIKYWFTTPHARYTSKVVWPNFDRFASVMEFDTNPPSLPFRLTFDTSPVALRFPHDDVMYYIYFLTPLRYEEVLTVIHDPRTRYEAFTDQIMLCYPRPVDSSNLRLPLPPSHE